MHIYITHTTWQHATDGKKSGTKSTLGSGTRILGTRIWNVLISEHEWSCPPVVPRWSWAKWTAAKSKLLELHWWTRRLMCPQRYEKREAARSTGSRRGVLACLDHSSLTSQPSRRGQELRVGWWRGTCSNVMGWHAPSGVRDCKKGHTWGDRQDNLENEAPPDVGGIRGSQGSPDINILPRTGWNQTGRGGRGGGGCWHTLKMMSRRPSENSFVFYVWQGLRSRCL